MNEDLFYQWLQFFASAIPSTRPAMLIVDNHESRFSLRIIEYCREQQIIILLLPPNATHLMQVGDVSIHAPFKKQLREQTGIFLHEHPRTSITKYHYARIIASAYIKSFTPSNIISGYEATGIHPYNPEKVKSHLTKHQSSSTIDPSVERIPLSEILTIPGQLNTPPSSPMKKPRRPGMPFTRILTSDQMKTYFDNQAASEQIKQEEKQIKKRKQIEKKQGKENKENMKRKQKSRIKKQTNDSNKENELSDTSDIDDDIMYDDTYTQSNATVNLSTLPSTTRRRRLAAESAHIKINLADYSW
jgi:hypothetical protein